MSERDHGGGIEIWGGLDALPWMCPVAGAVEIRPNTSSADWGAPCVASTFSPDRRRFRARAPDILQAFVALADAGEKRVAAFVRRYGPLNLHAGSGEPRGGLDGDVQLEHVVVEPVAAYRFYARAVRSALGAVQRPRILPHQLPAGTPGAEHGTAFALRPDLEPIRALMERRRTPEWKPDAKWFRWSLIAPGEGHFAAASVANWWLAVGNVTPAVQCFDWQAQRKVPPRLGLSGGAWGAIGIALLRAISTEGGAATICDFCGRAPLVRRQRRRKRGQSACCGRAECLRARDSAYKRARAARTVSE